MARKGNPISVRIDLNRSLDSSRFSEGDHESHRRGQSFPSPHIKKGGEGRCRCPGRTRLLLTLEDHWKTPKTKACRYQAEKAGKPLPYVSIASVARALAPSSARKASPDLRSDLKVESSNDANLGALEDASKQGRKIEDLDADAEVTLVTETQERNDEEILFDVHDDLQGDEVVSVKVIAEKEVSTADPVTTAGEGVTSANVEVTTASAPTTTIDELTLAQTLIEIKAAKPKVVTTDATTTTTTRPKAKGVVLQEPSEFKTTTSSLQASQLPKAKDKGKAIMLARKKEEEANIALIESWDNTQAMMDADFELAQRLEAEEQGEINIEERSRFFIELMNKRKKHFAKLRAEEIQRKPPTKAQKRNLMSTYLKNIGGYKYNQLKSKSYDEIQKLFDREMKRVNTFVDMNSKVVKGSETRIEESSKRAGYELESDKSKKQKVDEHVEAQKDDDPEEEEMKKHMEIVQDEEEIAIDVTPLAIKPLVIVKYKIFKEGKFVYFQLIRADGSSKRYLSMIKML
ncbi:hypothetical protein Tco_0642123 [Tanacetum coccineum]